MTLELTEQQKLEGMESRMLIDFGCTIQDEIDIKQKTYKIVKMILHKRMVKDNATAIHHPNIECKGKFSATTYLPHQLTRLKEHFSEEELIEQGFTPSEKRMVDFDEKWDMRKINGMKSFGDKTKAIIESATVKGDMVDVTFKRK